MRGVADRLRAALGGRGRGPSLDDGAHGLEELPGAASAITADRAWISDAVRTPTRRRADSPSRLIANIRANAEASIGELSRPAAIGTLIEGAMAFALDDAVDGNCEWLDIRILRDRSVMVVHGGPGFNPQRAARGLQTWPWLRRSPEGEVMLTRSKAAPVITCALSHWCRLEVRLAGTTWRQAFYRGRPESPLRAEPPDSLQLTQTRVHFRPDPALFPNPEPSIDDLFMRGLGLSVELMGIELRIHDERTVAAPLVLVGTG